MSLCIHDLEEGTCATCATPLKKTTKPKPKPKVAVVPYVPPVGQRKDWYSAVYLRSDHWRSLRKRAPKAMGNACYGCGASGREKRLELHHIGYTNLWQEKWSDLRLMCRECHEGTHGLAKELRCSLRSATKKWKKSKEGTYDPKIVDAERSRRGTSRRAIKQREYAMNLASKKRASNGQRIAASRGRGYKAGGAEADRRKGFGNT